MLLALAVAVVAGVSAWLLLDKPAFGIDDADITMVYARNLADGYGYVYRPLGERVEGSTSLLWTLICAAWFMTKPTSFGSLFLVTGAFNFVTALGVLKLARRASPNLEGVGFTALLLASAAAFHCWSAGTLMDLSLWTALVTVTFLALVVPVTRRRFWLAAVALVGLVVARPEGFALAPAGVCLQCALSLLRGEPSRRVMRRTGALLAIVVVVIAAITTFRVCYFGYPFPNTYYAKVGTDPVYTAMTGLSYVGWFLRKSPFSILVALAVGRELIQFARMLITRSRDANFRADPLALLRGAIAVELALGFSLRLVEGADHFAGHRTLQPFVPMGAALVGTSVAALLSNTSAKIGRFATPLLATSLALLIPLEWWLFDHGPAKSIRGEHGLAKHQREVGSTLAAVFPESAQRPSVGVVAAGGSLSPMPDRSTTYSGSIGCKWRTARRTVSVKWVTRRLVPTYSGKRRPRSFCPTSGRTNQPARVTFMTLGTTACCTV